MTVLSMQELLRKYDGAVPRYTSYPTAPHFRHTVTQTDYRALLQEIPESQSVSLYIHIPFCRHLCFYCGCHTKVVDHDVPLREYLGVVKQEIALAAAALGRRQKVSHIHFGGGTPNFAATDDLDDLLKTVSERFDLAEDAVIAMEMDPRILDEKKTHELVKLGVNRVSLGVQDFQPDVQEAVNRIQPYAHVENCVRWLRDAGVTSINFDMIYGLPLQTSGKIHDNMEKLKTLRPDRVALFGYAHVPWFKSHQKKLEAYPLPDTAERFAMAELARQDLIAAGYTPIGIDHFALPTDELAIALKEKRLHRNFQGYTADPDTALISFGQTSISQYNNAYVQNTDRNRDYRDTIAQGEFPLAKACLLSPEDIYRRAVIEAIMCYGAVDLKTLDGANLWAESAWTAA
jgi:oxygen-independent coproporphyrinogen-3 oxidase